MLQNVSPQQTYVPQQMGAVMQEPVPQMAAPQQFISQQAVPPCVVPVYNSIPYSSLYAPTASQPQCNPGVSSPHISTVSIEMNGIQPPNLQGLGMGQSQSAPQVMPQPQFIPSYMTSPVGMQPAPAAIPPYAMAGAMPQPIQAPVQEIAPPPPAIEQAPKAPAPAAMAETKPVAEVEAKVDDKEAIKPLTDALSVLVPQKGAPQPTVEAQSKAIQTVAQFARVAEASNQLIKANPDNPEAKDAKEKVDKLIKPNLIKEETFMGLADIMLKDTSKLNGEDKKKADMNRVYGMWTLAMLQKLFKEEMNTEAKKINIPPVSMGEVPGVAQISTLAIGDKQKNIKPDSNPEIREASLAALVNIADAQDPKDAALMNAILTEAAKDPDKKVKEAATQAIALYPANNQKAPAAQPVPAAQPAQPKQVKK